jgi:hypothetical protein
MTRHQFITNNARGGVSWVAMFRMWSTTILTRADRVREADERQSAIILAGLALGCVVKTSTGYEVV